MNTDEHGCRRDGLAGSPRRQGCSLLVSFGYRHGPPSSTPGTHVLDVRPLLRNPYHDRRLRRLNGLHPEVQADIHETADFAAVYAGIKARVQETTAATVYIGCTGGHHRSVYVAHRLGHELGVAVEHRDLNNP
jgi:UPF0042 nucleotide-binding protein